MTDKLLKYFSFLPMTEHNLPEKDDAPWLDTTYDGFKIQEQSFYDKLWELLETELDDTVLCDQMADRIYDLVKLYLVKEHYND